MPPEKSIFSFFVAYIYGILGVEAAATLKRIAIRLATTWQQPYTSICGYVNIGITIILVRATHLCIRGLRVLSHKINVQSPQCENGNGLNLFS